MLFAAKLRRLCGFQHRVGFFKKASRCLKPLLKKFAASTQQLRGKIRGPGGEPVSTGLVNGAISLDDHAILADCERKQHMAKNGE
jgi:hypothetical protein